MTVAVKVFLICCLLQGSLCQQWASFLPQTLQGLSGSCVRIPCRFTVLPTYESNVDGTCRVLWKKDASKNSLQGNLTGNLLEKDCTTILNSMESGNSGRYFLRVECDNGLKYSFESPKTRITIQNSLPAPTITPSTLEVEEGTEVRLNCTAPSPCPSLPPALTWTPTIGDTEENLAAKFMSSALNFTASDFHNGQRLVCSAVYRRQTATSDFEIDKSLTLRVFYPPKNTSVSFPDPVREGSSVTLTCSASANPAVSYIWYKVDGGQETQVGSKKQFSATVSEENSRFYCLVTNTYGSQRSAVTEMDVQFPPKETTVTVEPEGPILEGSSVTLLCRSRANPPVTNYTWYKDQEEDEASGASLLINDIDPSYSSDYLCKATNELGEQTSATVRLDVQYPPKNTSVSAAPSGPVQDGSSVTLTCTSIANPAAVNITWFRVVGGQTGLVGSEPDLTFNVTKLSDVYYKCEARNVHGAESSEPAIIDVTFAPEILISSHCDKISRGFRCTCESQGNPLPSLVWEYDGERVNNSATITISEVPLGDSIMRSIITLYSQDDSTPPLVCLSSNPLDSDSITFNLTTSETEPGPFSGLDSKSVLVGFAVGALGMLLVCVPLIFFFRKRKGSHSPDKGAGDTSDFLVTNGTNSSMVQVIYDNKAILKDEGKVEDDSLHYANVDFVKLQAKSAGKPGEGEIRGLDSTTSEYSEIRLHSRENNAGDTKKEETLANTQLGKGDDTVGLIG